MKTRSLPWAAMFLAVAPVTIIMGETTRGSRSIVTGPSAGAMPQVRSFTGTNRTPAREFLAYPPQ